MRKFLISLLLLTAITTLHSQSLELVKEINTIGNASPYGLTVANNKLFFLATDNSGYAKLWVTDGAETNTVELLSLPGMGITSIIAYNNKVYFGCNNGTNGNELWVSDGTVGGTSLFADLYPGPNGSVPQYFTVANNKLFFIAGNAAGEKRLFVTDGSTAGTLVLRNDYTDILNGMNNFAVFNNNIYFRGDSGDGSGYGLWKSNGTVAGTVLVKGNFIPGTMGGNYAVLNNRMFFSASDNTNGSELWATDGTAAGTVLVKNIAADLGSGVASNGAPAALTVFNSKIYFSAFDPDHGAEFWVTDGTTAGTQLVKDLFPGVTGSLPYQINLYNGSLYLLCWGTQELWRSDGTTAGTVLVKAISQFTKFTANWNNRMYMSSNNDYSVWQSDGTAVNTFPAKADNNSAFITSYTADQRFVEYNGGLYFSASCPGISATYELCRLAAGSAVHNFVFTGSGNWSNPANWAGGIAPPATLLAGDNVSIKGNCILDIAVKANSGSTITVETGATLVINGSLTII